MARATGGLLQRLDQGPVIGDGGFISELERRGFVEAGPWTPEAVVENPDAVAQLHKEFVRAGSDVCQAFTYYASEDKLSNRGNKAGQYGCRAINDAACKIVAEVAKPAGCLIAGGLSQTPTYLTGGENSKAAVQEVVRKQLEVFKENNVDLMILEYYEHVEEAEWHIEEVKTYMPEVPVCCTLCIGEKTDVHGVPTGECGVRLARAGADVVGINCHFDPFRCVAGVKKMIKAVKEAGFDKVHFMTQPVAFMTPDANVQGFIDLPEFPFALEPRKITRFDAAKYARLAYEAGIRYIGGCCGFEAYHTRAISEELTSERGGYLPVNCISWGKCLEKHTKPWVRARASRKYWEELEPATGRSFSASHSKCDGWGITVGHESLKQHIEGTSKSELLKETNLANKHINNGEEVA